MATKRSLLKKDLKEKRELVNIVLDRFLPRKDEYPKDIHKAIRHTLFAGGKRIRPYLTIRTYNLFKEDISVIQPIAAAIELLHTYTLIHDDLPFIDDDDYRRGKKSCHTVYGTNMAILAGDALLIYAFSLMNSIEIETGFKLKLIKEMSEISGNKGLIAGQFVDIKSEGKKADKKKLNYIHENKTAKLIKMSIRFGLYAAEASDSDLKRMLKYGDKIGLAFQIIDDILDVEGMDSSLGKTTGKDEEAEKMTFPAVYGLARSKTMADELIEESKAILSHYGADSELLLQLTDYILKRRF